MCKVNYADMQMFYFWISAGFGRLSPVNSWLVGNFPLSGRIHPSIVRCNLVYTTNPVPPNPKKIEALRSSGALNRHPQKVRHPLFAEHDFFDPNDMVQLKYETVRAVEVDGRPIAQAALDYGLSRPTIYEAQENFRCSEPDLKATALVQRVRRRFGIVLHPRTVEKAVRKKGRQTS